MFLQRSFHFANHTHNVTTRLIFYSIFLWKWMPEEFTKHADSVYESGMNKNIKRIPWRSADLTKPSFCAWNLSAYLWKFFKGYINIKSIYLAIIKSPAIKQRLGKAWFQEVTQTKRTVTSPLAGCRMRPLAGGDCAQRNNCLTCPLKDVELYVGPWTSQLFSAPSCTCVWGLGLPEPDGRPEGDNKEQ